ncbi:MAG TPA: hypothetical protein VIL46_16730 [Gemmataceae bacterium]
MRAEYYPIANVPSGRLAVMPRPRAGDWLADEIASWRDEGLDVVVSLLEESEVAELGLERVPELCAKAGMRFISFPIPDRGVPASRSELSNLVKSLAEELRQGRGVGLYCRFGVGRSALVAVCLLVQLGRPLDEAWADVEQARGMAVPETEEQRQWAASWAGGGGTAADLFA